MNEDLKDASFQFFMSVIFLLSSVALFFIFPSYFYFSFFYLLFSIAITYRSWRTYMLLCMERDVYSEYQIQIQHNGLFFVHNVGGNMTEQEVIDFFVSRFGKFMIEKETRNILKYLRSE